MAFLFVVDKGFSQLGSALVKGRAVVVVVALFVGHLLTACGSDNNVAPQIPVVSFSETINITNQQYTALRADNGAVYTAGGVRGLIVVHQNASTYFAFERNCPYRASDTTCSRVGIDASRLFLKDPCCGSQFDLQGRVQSGLASFPLRQYRVSLSGNILSITN